MMKMEKWQQRYPEIGFFLSFFPYEAIDLPKNPSPFLTWLRNQKLEEVEVLFIVGLFGFSLPEKVLQWLFEKKERSLVFLEEELGAFACFSEEELLDHPQIHFHYLQENSIAQLSELFPTDRVAVFSKKSFDSEELIRSCATLSALYSDVLYSHQIVENVCINYRRLKDSFDARIQFKDTPAVICGAGPSLAKALPILKEQRDKALIFAGGSAITALTVAGCKPHFGIALDPNAEEFDRLQQSYYFEGPFLFAPRLHHLVFSTANGPFGYLKSDTGGLIENFLEEKLGIEGNAVGPDLGAEAFSVTTLAVAYAFALGCNPIIFAGVDLAYTGGNRYVSGVEAEAQQKEDPRSLEKRKMRTDIYGNPIETLLKWEMESDCIAAFAKEHPEVKFLNATEGGLGFKGVANRSLQEIFTKISPRDLDGEIHQKVQTAPLSCQHELLDPTWIALETSLKTCENLCAEIYSALERNASEGSLALYQSDLKEEIAYPSLLEGIDVALSRILFRYYPHLDPVEGKREREIAKYRELKRQIENFRSILQKQIAQMKIKT